MSTALVPYVETHPANVSQVDKRYVKYLHDRHNKEVIVGLVNKGVDSGVDVLRLIAGNTALSLVASFTIIEALQRTYRDVDYGWYIRREPLMPETAGNLLETALTAEAVLSSMGASGLMEIITGLFAK